VEEGRWERDAAMEIEMREEAAMVEVRREGTMVQRRGWKGRMVTSTRYAFRGTLGRGIFQSAPKYSDLGHFNQTVSNSYIIWNTLVKVPLIRRFLGHFEEVPQKIVTFWGIFQDVPQKMATFGALTDVPQKPTLFGALLDVIIILYTYITSN
jgi:hypothetical protein